MVCRCERASRGQLRSVQGGDICTVDKISWKPVTGIVIMEYATYQLQKGVSIASAGRGNHTMLLRRPVIPVTNLKGLVTRSSSDILAVF